MTLASLSNWQKIALILVIGSLCLSGCGKKKNSQEIQKNNPVEIMHVQPTEFISYRTISGITNAAEDITLSAETTGQIESFQYEIGSPVKKDQILAKVNEQIAKAQLNAANANLKLIKTTFGMQEDLYKKQLISQQQFESVNTQYEVAKSNYDLAELQYNKTNIRAPIDGLLAEKYKHEKEFIAQGMPLCRIITLNPIKITMGVTGKDLAALQINQNVTVELPSVADRAYTGTIKTISSIADSDSRTFQVEISIPNPRNTIKAGMLCTISFINTRYAKAIVIPQDLILEGEEKGVLIAKDNLAVRIPIKILATQKNLAAVEGIEPNTAIITVGHKNLVEGDKITIKKQP